MSMAAMIPPPEVEYPDDDILDFGKPDKLRYPYHFCGVDGFKGVDLAAEKKSYAFEPLFLGIFDLRKPLPVFFLISARMD